MGRRSLLIAQAVAAVLFAPRAIAQVDFASEVHPILASRCAACHTGPSAQAGLQIEHRPSILRARDKILPRVRGTSGLRMPPTGDPLTPAQIGILEKWIADDLPWTDVSARKVSGWQAPLEPRTPALPASKEPNPIDRFVDAYYRGRNLDFTAPATDSVFARRAYLDIWGVTPLPEQLTFASRDKLIDALLADRPRYAAHWISFWNDLLRNDIRAYYGESKSYMGWLQNALEANMPYDEMVRQLVNPIGADSPEGFLIGVNWRGDVNASQLPHMQAAQNTAQVFLGVNLKCASCHDSFVNQYKLKQSYGMAAMFSETPQLEIVRCDNKTGRTQGPEFLFPSLGAIPAGSLAERRAAAAALFTHPRNGRLARTFVNRIWGRLFGRALVEPVDDMDAEPWNNDLLDWLAADFAANGYDMQRLLKIIMTSRAWQQASVPPESGKTYTFRGPYSRRLTAEQFVDTLSLLTGEWRLFQSDRSARFAREWEFRSTSLSRALGRPIRDQVYTTRPSESSTLQALELVNGETLALALRRGAQRLTGTLPKAAESLWDSKTLRRDQTLAFDVPLNGAQEVWLLMEDAGSYDAEATNARWLHLRFDAGSAALPEGRIPFGKPVRVPVPSGASRILGTAALDENGKQSDVNSAVRFYIFPSIPDRNLLARITAPPPFPPPAPVTDPDRLVTRLFLQTLGRPPADAEKRLALSALIEGGSISQTGLDDLLWTLLLHTEFQYVQ
jgi:mono/diheme cytochrome c family protein